MKNLVLFKEVCQFEGKLIVQEVPREVKVSDGAVIEESFEQELDLAGLEAVVGQVEFDEASVELDTISQEQQDIEF